MYDVSCLIYSHKYEYQCLICLFSKFYFTMQNYSDEKIVEFINNGIIVFSKDHQSDEEFSKNNGINVYLRFYTGDLQWTRTLDLKVKLIKHKLHESHGEEETEPQFCSKSLNKTSEPNILETNKTKSTEQNQQINIGKQITNPFGTWLKLVSQLSSALKNASNLDELRENYNCMVENIESKMKAEYSDLKDSSQNYQKAPPTNEVLRSTPERSREVIQYDKPSQLKDGTTASVKEVKTDHEPFQNLKVPINNHSKEKLYECSYCPKFFENAHNLNLHVKSHTIEKKYTCNYCPKSFTKPYKLEIHIRKHTGDKPFKCSLCDKAFAEKQNHDVHLRTHTGERPFVCTHCGKAFSTQSNCRAHMKRHSEEKPYQCNQCGQEFKFSVDLRYHMMIHNGERPFKCSHCDKSFTLRKNFNQHMKVHSGVKPFKCTICEKSFVTKNQCTTHMETHNEGKPLIHLEKKSKPYKCDHCEQDFATKIKCVAHMKKHDTPYQCNICEKGFITINKLYLHMTKHSKKQFKCNLCNKAYHIEKSLQRHIKTHTEDAGNKFIGADKLFDKENLQNEHSSIKIEENVQPCSHCDAAFNSDSELMSHIRDMHNCGNDEPLTEPIFCLDV